MSIKSFVSEAQLDERRKRRQEEWEKVRRPDQPLGKWAKALQFFCQPSYFVPTEAPEEEYDPRSLYERLQANKIKKQEEYEESKRLKHLVRGLDNDEISFLEMVDQNKIQEEILREREEREAIKEFQEACAHLSEKEQESKLEDFKKSISLNLTNFEKKPAKRKTLIDLMIKRKSNLEETDLKNKKLKNEKGQVEKDDSKLTKNKPSSLLALAAYDSNDSDSESELESESESKDNKVDTTLIKIK